MPVSSHIEAGGRLRSSISQAREGLTIQCEKCKSENDGQASTCTKCQADLEAEIELHSQARASALPQRIEPILRDRSAAHRKLGHAVQADWDLVDALRAAEAFALNAGIQDERRRQRERTR